MITLDDSNQVRTIRIVEIDTFIKNILYLNVCIFLPEVDNSNLIILYIYNILHILLTIKFNNVTNRIHYTLNLQLRSYTASVIRSAKVILQT